MEKVVSIRPLSEEGIPPTYDDPVESFQVFAELLNCGKLFYPDAENSSPLRSKAYRIIPLAEK